jgi:hypothetical protein
VESPSYFSIDFKPNVSLSAAIDNWTDGHQSNNQCFAFLDGDMHFFANIGPS